MRQISVNSLDPDTEYLISVRAIDADGLESAWSLPLRHTTGPAMFSDGLVPESSPEPVTVGGLRQIFVKWDRISNKDIVEYEVHCVKSDTMPTEPPVPGDPETLIATTAATMIAATALPNGEPFQYQPDGVENTEENAEIKQNYWFSIIATDKDGPADEPSPWVAGSMDRTAAGDIVAGAITAELINAVLIFAGEFKLQGDLISISPPTVGDNGELEGGIIVYDHANPANKLIQLHPHGSYFHGAVEAQILTIIKDFELQGTGSLTAGASMKIAHGVSDPDKPATVASTIPTVQSLPSVPSGYTMRGMCFAEDAAGAGNHYYYRLLEHNTNKKPYLQTINASTGGQVGSLTALPVVSNATLRNLLPGIGKPPLSSYTFSFSASGGITYYNGSVYYLVSQRAQTYSPPNGGVGWWVPDTIVTFLVRATPAGVFQNYIKTGTYREMDLQAGDPEWDGLAHYKGVGLNNGPSTAIGKILVSGAMTTTSKAVRSFNPSLSTEMASIANSAIAYNTVVRFIGIDDFDFDDGPKLVIGVHNSIRVMNTSNPPTNTLFEPVHDSVKTFGGASQFPYVTTYGGFCWHKERNAFVVNAGDTSLRQFSNYYPPSGADFEDWAVKYVNTGPGGKTTRESPVSNVARVYKRAYLSVTLPPAPQGVTNAEVYAGQASSGTPTTFYKRTEDFSVRTGVLWNGRDTTGTTILPDFNNFGGNPGKVFSDAGGFEVNGDGTGAWPYIMPTGAILMYGGSSVAPDGFLLCDGSAVSRTAYAELFAVIGTSYGAGDGTSTFNVPNFNARFPRQAAPGATGGANSRTLTTAQLPSHSHGLNASYNLGTNTAAGGSSQRITGWTFGTSADVQRTGSTSDAGSGQAFDNQPAYLGVNFIIKI